ncbi:hypothetical protein ABBQ38_006814 [Trebouxia sp. C0009 RCD-2024]
MHLRGKQTLVGAAAKIRAPGAEPYSQEAQGHLPAAQAGEGEGRRQAVHAKERHAEHVKECRACNYVDMSV